MKQPSMQVAFGLVLGAGAGVAIAMIAGVGGMWLAIGIALGVLVGSWMTRKSRTASDAHSSRGALVSELRMKSKHELP